MFYFVFLVLNFHNSYVTNIYLYENENQYQLYTHTRTFQSLFFNKNFNLSSK